MGTRPEAIKLAPVILALKRMPSMRVRVVSTGQHQAMVQQVLKAFGLTPHDHLLIMRPSQSLGEVTRRVLDRLPPVIKRESPHLILVQGDTTTAFAAALAGFYAKIPVGHVEAGLRTHQKYAPFPEEINRVLVDQLADLHFAATPSSKRNLFREGISPTSIHVTGNTVVDALQFVRRKPWRIHERQLRLVPWRQRVMLVTMHRREHWGRPLDQVCRAVVRLVADHADLHVVLPVHPNPSVKSLVEGKLKGHRHVTLTPPLGYEDFIQVMARSYVILTDSGGVQEEAPYLGKPVLVFREATERPEAVRAGASRVIGFDQQAIVREVSGLMDNPRRYAVMAQVRHPFGDGQASRRIVQALKKYLAG